MIKIKPSTSCDTRSAKKDTSYEEFSLANDSHINDVNRVMTLLSDMLKERGKMHDHTKKDFEEEQYKAFHEALNGGEPFNQSSWYKMHVKSERHHLFSNCPDDVNLIDVLEMISDISVAALARSGERVHDIDIPEETLKRALHNTIKIINDNIKLDK